MSITNITQEEINKCKSDPAYFFQKYVRLVTKDGRVVPINYTQVKLRADILKKIQEKLERK